MGMMKEMCCALAYLMNIDVEQVMGHDILKQVADGQPFPILRRRLEEHGWPTEPGVHRHNDMLWEITNHWIPTVVELRWRGVPKDVQETRRKALNPRNLEPGQYWLQLDTAGTKHGTRMGNRMDLVNELLELLAKHLRILHEEDYTVQANIQVTVDPPALWDEQNGMHVAVGIDTKEDLAHCPDCDATECGHCDADLGNGIDATA